MNRHSGGLGRGLAALIPAGEQEGISLQELSLSAISPNPRQPRGVFDELELEELAASIRDVGLLQPVVVRPLGNERYELIAGERRLRAAKLAGLTRLPAVVRDTPDTGLLKEALIENIHRVQLNPLEEAAAYQQLLDDFQVSQEELATALGKSRPVISNALRLLSLPPPVQRKVAAGVLTAGHAKALLALEDRAAQERLADRIVAEGLSVRSTEEVVRHQLVGDSGDAAGGAGERGGSSSRSGSGGSGPARSPGLAELEENLSDALMTRVKVSMGARKGRISIELASVDDLERIVGVIARGVQEDIPVSASE